MLSSFGEGLLVHRDCRVGVVLACWLVVKRSVLGGSSLSSLVFSPLPGFSSFERVVFGVLGAGSSYPLSGVRPIVFLVRV
jgi:hypothetical protein